MSNVPLDYLDGLFRLHWKKNIPPDEYRAAIQLVLDFLGVVQQLRRPAEPQPLPARRSSPAPAGGPRRRKAPSRDRLLKLLQQATEPLTTEELAKHAKVSRTSAPAMLRSAGLQPVGKRGAKLLWPHGGRP